MSWHHGGLAAFDIETTGVDVETDRIVTAALVEVTADGIQLERSWVVDPSIEIPTGASNVHGVTTQIARTFGEPPHRAIGEIVDLLTDACRRGLPIVAFNARFDLTILDREARRHGHTPLGDRTDDLCVVDPYVCDKQLDRYRRGKRKLADICTHYRVTLDEAHEATADAIAAARVAWRMATSTTLRDFDRATLHAAQATWARDQAISLADHFARQGRPQHVEPAWPIVPTPEDLAA